MEVRTTGSEVRIVKTASEELAFFFSNTLELIRDCEQQMLETRSNFKQVEMTLSCAFKKGAGTVAFGIAA